MVIFAICYLHIIVRLFLNSKSWKFSLEDDFVNECVYGKFSDWYEQEDTLCHY